MKYNHNCSSKMKKQEWNTVTILKTERLKKCTDCDGFHDTNMHIWQMNAAMTTNNGQTNKKTQKPHANSTQNRYATGVVQNLGTKLSHGTTWLGQHRHIWPLTTKPETTYVAKQNETQNSGTTSNCVTRAKDANHPWCLSPLKTRAVQQQTYSRQSHFCLPA